AGPFGCVRPAGHRVVRKFAGSPVSVYRWSCDLTEHHGRVRLSFTADITLRWRALAPLVRMIGSRDIRKIADTFSKAAERFTRVGTPVYAHHPGEMAVGAHQRLPPRHPP